MIARAKAGTIIIYGISIWCWRAKYSGTRKSELDKITWLKFRTNGINCISKWFPWCRGCACAIGKYCKATREVYLCFHGVFPSSYSRLVHYTCLLALERPWLRMINFALLRTYIHNYIFRSQIPNDVCRANQNRTKTTVALPIGNIQWRTKH
jgi:hypothetical protein